MPFRPRFLALTVVGVLLIPCAWADLASAGEVPESALADAFAMAPELVDSGAQVFVHPQRAVEDRSSVVSYAQWNAAGFTLSRPGRVAVIALAQSPRPDINSFDDSRTFQGGVACGIGAIRLGAAFREGRSKDAAASEFVQIATSEVHREQSYRRDSFREIAAGIGFSRGRGSIDASVGLSRIEREAFGSEQDRSRYDEFAADIDGRTLWGGTLLAALPVGARNVVRVVGAFHDRRADVRLVARSTSYLPISYQEALYGHAWNAGLALDHDLGASRVCRLHAHYLDVRDPGQPTGRSYLFIDSDRRQLAETGISLQRPGWWGETLHLGVRGFLTKFSEESTEVGSASARFSSRSAESFSHAFSWGASRSFGDLDLVGLVSSTLSLGDPFASIDAALRF